MRVARYPGAIGEDTSKVTRVVMECREVCDLADVYLDDELLVETNHAVLAHLQHCRACHEELKTRWALRTMLKNAFDNDERLTPSAASRPY